jgi:hypothetical protein
MVGETLDPPDCRDVAAAAASAVLTPAASAVDRVHGFETSLEMDETGSSTTN